MDASDEDIVLFNDPSVVAAATHSNERKADAGDFDTSKDWRITGYLKDKWNGYRPEQQIQSMAKLVVTIWARDHSDYHTKQLGNNFTGAKNLGGLLSAIGRSRSHGSVEGQRSQRYRRRKALQQTEYNHSRGP